jgi:16S rRNA processing protein RimM
VGRVVAHRGGAGELTIRVDGGPAAAWEPVAKVWLGPPGGEFRPFTVERSRSYRDRWVVKLLGVDSVSEASRLVRSCVEVAGDDAPPLPPGTHRVASLLGLRAVDEGGAPLGTVAHVVSTGGTDLLAVHDADGRELLVPFARAFVLEIDTVGRSVRLRLPPGLRDADAG